MPATIQCPSCQHVMHLPEGSRGTTIECLACAASIAVGADASRSWAIPVEDMPYPSAIKGDGPPFAELVLPTEQELNVDSRLTECPDCQISLFLLVTHLGRKVRCPRCSAVFVGDAVEPKPVVEAVAADVRVSLRKRSPRCTRGVRAR